MKKKGLIVSLALLLVVTFGWGEPLLQYSANAEVQSQSQSQDQVIRVEGVAEIKIKPDLALISLAVETKGNSADVASEENAKLTESVISALKKFGLEEDQLETNNYRLYSTREPIELRTEEPNYITSYRATNELNISTDNLN